MFLIYLRLIHFPECNLGYMGGRAVKSLEWGNNGAVKTVEPISMLE